MIREPAAFLGERPSVGSTVALSLGDYAKQSQFSVVYMKAKVCCENGLHGLCLKPAPENKPNFQGKRNVFQ